jgi:hypothetical protein
MDFSMHTNEGIKNYFNGSNDYVPTSELVYIHTHPLISPNFLVEINLLVAETAEIISAKNLKGHTLREFTDIAVNIGKAIPDLTTENAEALLIQLRNLYNFCNSLKETFK